MLKMIMSSTFTSLLSGVLEQAREIAEHGAPGVLRVPRSLLRREWRRDLAERRTDPIRDRLELDEVEVVHAGRARRQERVEVVLRKVPHDGANRLERVRARPLGVRDVGTPHEVRTAEVVRLPEIVCGTGDVAVRREVLAGELLQRGDRVPDVL